MQGYRADIDGLRAVAVGAVLLFHGLPWLAPGGYVGVDVFFVISGFLITGILLGEVEEGRFSILRFYVRRARRLFPALLVVVAAVALAGWLTLLPGEFAALGRHVTGGSLFASNLVLWREAGYFDVNSEFKPLLHLWSLGVEEQYYLLWPLVVSVLAPRGTRVVAAGAGVLALASFAVGEARVAGAPVAAFFLPDGRVWELLVGSLLAVTARRGPVVPAGSGADVLSLAGGVLVVLPVVAYGAATPFPGWAAAAPVLGTAAVIAAGPAALLNARVLSARPMVAVGLISYPLYLWHWPLLAFPRIVAEGDIPAAQALAALGLAFLLAWLTWRVVERPFRARGSAAANARQAALLWAALLGVGALGGLAWAGLLAPRAASSPAVALVAAAQADWREVPDQRWPGAGPAVLFIGDSHMQQYLPRIERLATERGGALHPIELRTAAGCAPVAGIERRGQQCNDFATGALARAAAADVGTVVIAASWYGFSTRGDYYVAAGAPDEPVDPFAPAGAWVLERWADQLGALVAAGKRVVVVTQSPGGAAASPARRLDRGFLHWEAVPLRTVAREELARPVAAANGRIATLARAAGAEILDPYDWLCTATECRVAGDGGEPLYKDKTHLRASFVRESFTLFDAFVEATPVGPPR